MALAGGETMKRLFRVLLFLFFFALAFAGGSSAVESATYSMVLLMWISHEIEQKEPDDEKPV